MPGQTENIARRMRIVLEALAENPDGLRTGPGDDGLYARAAATVPWDEGEQQLRPDGTLNGATGLAWASVDYVKAGWLEKSGTGIWKITDSGRQALGEYSDPVDMMREARTRYEKWRQGEREKLAMVIVPDSEERAFRAAAQLFVKDGLQAGGSVFSHGRQVWTRAAFEELRTKFIEAPDLDVDTFLNKLRVQLADVSDDARLLMAEVVAWQVLPIYKGAIGERAKVARIESVLANMAHPVLIPDDILSGLSPGVFNPGPAMSNDLYNAVVLILNLLDQWLGLSSETQQVLLSDPWEWKKFVLGVPGPKFPTQRNSLIYCVHPDTFTPIVSETHKEQIREAFIGEIVESTGDIDRDLLEIVLQLQQKSGRPVEFYEDPWVKEWKNVNQTPKINPGPADDPEGGTPESTGVRLPFPSADSSLSNIVYMDQPRLISSITKT